MNKIEYEEILTFHPGYYVNDIINDMEISQKEFAMRLDTSSKNISELVNGQIELSKEMALKLSSMTGTSLDLWLNLQKTYSGKVLEIEFRKAIDRQMCVFSQIDFSFFIKLGLLQDTKNKVENMKNLCSYLKISDMEILKRHDMLANYRKGTSAVEEKNVINSNVWLQTALNIGRQIETKEYNELKLKSYIQKIRTMTVDDPHAFIPLIKDGLSECGVSFVLLPTLKNSGIYGAVKWINERKVILAINDLRKYADAFWFSLFHEIKHVLQKKIKKVIVNGPDNILEIDACLEKEANEFAQNTLIPPLEYENSFIRNRSYITEDSIIEFADKIGIHPGIVVGRLQKDGLVELSHYNGLRVKYEVTC
ncbi:MAG: HigA family addiction module antitoxin [Clostridia bacterium]